MPEGDQSWPTLRKLYYDALTASGDTRRRALFARLFKGLGHQMHLVEDMAVPAHVRNDSHPRESLQGSESWWKRQIVRKNPLYFEAWAKKNAATIIDMAATGAIFPHLDYQTAYPGGMVSSPISQLWDANVYDGTNPSSTTTQGLSEYTNANYYSEDTVFAAEYLDPADSHYFPYPRQADTDLLNIADLLPEQYAARLVHRAVGYSAALLDYFFRGNLDIKKAYFTYGADMSLSGMDLEFKNISTPLISGQQVEPLAGGRIDLVYRYLPPGEKENAEAESRDPVFTYGLVRDIYTVADETDPVNSEYVIAQQDIVFTPPIAAGSEEIAFKLVYHGALGNEPGAVFAASQNNRSQIAYHLQPNGRPNPSHIYTASPDGGPKRAITTGAGINPWYANPTWSRDGRKLAFEKQYCTHFDAATKTCDSGKLCDERKYLSDIVVVDLTSQDPFPMNVAGTFHLEDTPDCVSSSCQDKSLTLTSPSFSPEGDRFVALAGGTVSENPMFDALVVFDIDTGQWRYLGGCDKWYHYIVYGSAPAWNPQDDTIAFARQSTPSDEPSGGQYLIGRAIYVIGAAGENEIQITGDEFADIQPAWSPDGQWLVFASNRDGGDIYHIWMVDRDGNNLHKVRDCGQESCYSPSFSPDGLNITFRQGAYIFTTDIWGQNLVQVTRPNADPDIIDFTTSPEWSPALEKPAAEIYADPATIHSGESTTLTWTCGNAHSAEIDNGIGTVEPSGSVTVAPAATTTYTLSVTELGGTAEDSVTVTVD